MRVFSGVTIAIIGLASVVFSGCGGSSQTDADAGSVRVERGEIVRQALATGGVTVEHEAPVKSTMGGILSNLYVELGQRVSVGEPLAEVRPVVTTQDLIDMERSLEFADDGVENAQEYIQGSHAAALFTRMLTGRKSLERLRRQAELNKQQAEERLNLLEDGSATVSGRTLDFNVRAPVDGNVIEIVTRVGAPVVSSSSFGSGTVLVVLADHDRMLFVGTVDEIDVGRLKIGIPASIRVGALPGETLMGTVTEIGLKSTTLNNASVFEVRIELQETSNLTLRSGYSAVAEIELDRRENVLTVPERVIQFQDDATFARVRDSSGREEETPVRLGLSDGLTVEILEGLSEGDVVLERY